MVCLCQPELQMQLLTLSLLGIAWLGGLEPWVESLESCDSVMKFPWPSQWHDFPVFAIRVSDVAL